MGLYAWRVCGVLFGVVVVVLSLVLAWGFVLPSCIFTSDPSFISSISRG